MSNVKSVVWYLVVVGFFGWFAIALTRQMADTGHTSWAVVFGVVAVAFAACFVTVVVMGARAWTAGRRGVAAPGA